MIWHLEFDVHSVWIIFNHEGWLPGLAIVRLRFSQPRNRENFFRRLNAPTGTALELVDGGGWRLELTFGYQRFEVLLPVDKGRGVDVNCKEQWPDQQNCLSHHYHRMEWNLKGFRNQIVIRTQQLPRCKADDE